VEDILEEKKIKRFEDIKVWLSKFQLISEKIWDNKIIYSEGSLDATARKLNTAYWFFLESTVRRYVKGKFEGETNLHHTKIISGLELVIIAQRPIISCSRKEPIPILKKHQDWVGQDNLQSDFVIQNNVFLAWFIGIAIMNSWNEFNPKKVDEICDNSEDVIKFIVEHLIWLINLKPDFEYPLFLNAQVWRLFSNYIKVQLQ
jgi:hypothetical protein